MKFIVPKITAIDFLLVVFQKESKLTESESALFKASRDIIGGAFAGFVAALVLRGIPDIALQILALILILMLALLYKTHEKIDQISPWIAAKLTKFRKGSYDSVQPDRIKSDWPPNQGS